MIIEHVVNGSKETSYHNIQITAANLDFTLKSGSYFQNGQEIFNMINDTVVSIPLANQLTHYEIWITKNGFSILTRTDTEDFAYSHLINQIDRLCWFSVPASCTDLSTLDIHLVKVVE
jgi:hypothetical protein